MHLPCDLQGAHHPLPSGQAQRCPQSWPHPSRDTLPACTLSSGGGGAVPDPLLGVGGRREVKGDGRISEDPLQLVIYIVARKQGPPSVSQLWERGGGDMRRTPHPHAPHSHRRGPTPFPGGTLHSNGAPQTQTRHLRRCSRLTTCRWTWNTAWPQKGHQVGGTTV